MDNNTSGITIQGVEFESQAEYMLYHGWVLGLTGTAQDEKPFRLIYGSEIYGTHYIFDAEKFAATWKEFDDEGSIFYYQLEDRGTHDIDIFIQIRCTEAPGEMGNIPDDWNWPTGILTEDHDLYSFGTPR